MHAYDDLGDSALIEKYKNAWIDLVARCRLGKAPDMKDLNEFHWISMAIQQRQLRQTAEYQKMITAADEEAWKRVEMTARPTL